MRRRDFVSLVALGAAANLPVRRREPQFVERWSWAMGQSVHLRLFHDSADAGRVAAQDALTELRRLEGVLSRFDPASELSELNRSAGGKPLRVSPDLAAVLVRAERFRRLTADAFHPGVEPLMEAWGFRDLRGREPTGAELAEAEAAVRAATIVLEGDRCHLRGSHTRLDLGGIAVGYGLDRMGRLLRGRGVRRALLEVGGDILALGAPPGEEGWRIDLADSEHPGRMLRSVLIRDQALATSARTVSVARVGRRLVGHVMDPRTGYPAAARRQVTVTSATGVEADALSTALLVSGRPAAGVERYWLT